MRTLTEIEADAMALPATQQAALLRRLTERLQERPANPGRLPLVSATGHPITQEEIDDALDTD